MALAPAGSLKEGIRIAAAHLLTEEPDDSISCPCDQQVTIVIESCAVDGNGLWVQRELKLGIQTEAPLTGQSNADPTGSPCQGLLLKKRSEHLCALLRGHAIGPSTALRQTTHVRAVMSNHTSAAQAFPSRVDSKLSLTEHSCSQQELAVHQLPFTAGSPERHRTPTSQSCSRPFLRSPTSTGPNKARGIHEI